VKVIQIIEKVEFILKDEGTRWTRLELQSWLNEFYAALTDVRPDANSKTGEFTCVAGSRQNLTTIFANAARLIDVVRNTATGSKKRAVTLIERRIMDDMRPDWHSVTKSINVQHYMYDELVPREFLVYPPALATAKLEVVYSEVPAAHALTEEQLDPENDNSTLINVHPVYAPSAVDYILYRAFSKDSGVQNGLARASMHLNAYGLTLGQKTAVDQATNPNRREG
jgi:hypothetical protein